jgi:hypothetical protein
VSAVFSPKIYFARTVLDQTVSGRGSDIALCAAAQRAAG